MKKTLMIVDDSLFIYEEMKLILQGSDFEIVGYAKNGEQALEDFDRLHPEVVTMDIILPGMDGIETARTMLERAPQTKVIIVSSLAYDETLDQSREIGASDFLFKPFDGEQLLNALHKAAG